MKARLRVRFMDARVLVLSDALGKRCTELGVPYLEVFSAMSSNKAWRREAASGDGAHPNSDGYAALAGLIGNWIAWRGWLEMKYPDSD